MAEILRRSDLFERTLPSQSGREPDRLLHVFASGGSLYVRIATRQDESGYIVMLGRDDVEDLLDALKRGGPR